MLLRAITKPILCTTVRQGYGGNGTFRVSGDAGTGIVPALLQGYAMQLRSYQEDIAMMDTSEPRPRHHPLEDALALVIGILLISFGVRCYLLQNFMVGSTAGMAFLIHYVSAWSFGSCFFVINLPFYILSFMRMGWQFTVRTFIAVIMLSYSTDILSGKLTLFGYHIEPFQGMHMHPLYASVMGGLLMGVGFLILFRHGFSLGGINILALFCQKQFGIRAGLLQMIIDLCLMAVAFTVLSWDAVLYSVIGAVLLNLVLLMNFNSKRYIAFS